MLWRNEDGLKQAAPLLPLSVLLLSPKHGDGFLKDLGIASSMPHPRRPPHLFTPTGKIHPDETNERARHALGSMSPLSLYHWRLAWPWSQRSGGGGLCARICEDGRGEERRERQREILRDKWSAKLRNSRRPSRPRVRPMPGLRALKVFTSA